MAAFGDLLSELRRDMNMTQDELAKVLFVSPGTISNYENNIHFPDVPKLKQIAQYFGMTTDYLLGLSSCDLSPRGVGETDGFGKNMEPDHSGCPDPHARQATGAAAHS